MLRQTLTTLLMLFLASRTSAGVLALEDGPPAASRLSPLVTTEWLAEHLEDSDLVVAHIGPQGSYEREHIPGAVPLSVRALVTNTPEGLRDEMPPLEEIAEALAAAGVTDESRVVICVADERAMPFAARVFLTLEYVGLLGRSAVLDGGLPVWKAEGRPVTQEAPPVEVGGLSLAPRPEVLANAEWLETNLRLASVAVIDARPPEGYSGSGGHGDWPRPGHIPTAANIPFFAVMAEDSPARLKSEKELWDLFGEAGAKPESLVVVYCGTGIWASSVYLAARHLGLQVRFYDGSFQEWSSDESLPVTGPVSKRDLL